MPGGGPGRCDGRRPMAGAGGGGGSEGGRGGGTDGERGAELGDMELDGPALVEPLETGAAGRDEPLVLAGAEAFTGFLPFDFAGVLAAVAFVAGRAVDAARAAVP